MTLSLTVINSRLIKHKSTFCGTRYICPTAPCLKLLRHFHLWLQLADIWVHITPKSRSICPKCRSQRSVIRISWNFESWL